MNSPKNNAASIRQRLLNRAKTDGRPFNELLQYYAMERFLCRLSLSPHSGLFVLKGALMLRVWGSPEFRPIMDIDMLGNTSNQLADILAKVRDIMALEVEPDGIEFLLDSIRSERITEDADYQGVRLRFLGMLGTARVNMQLDIGFGDVVYPACIKSSFPTTLDSPSPELLCYSKESAIAEKFEAMVKLGTLNSRMKDFFDIWLLCQNFEFNSLVLAEAIRQTFANRGTLIFVPVEAFEQIFIDAKQKQWAAFCRRLQPNPAPMAFEEVVAVLKTFLGPVFLELAQGHVQSKNWTANGPWS